MIQVRRAEERGRTEWGWLDSRHTFSFGDYDDPGHRGFRALRVLNDDRDGSLQVQQDVDVWVTRLDAGQERERRLAPGRHAWIHVARGAVSVNGTDLREGDGAAVSGEDRLPFLGRDAAEVLVFDLG